MYHDAGIFFEIWGRQGGHRHEDLGIAFWKLNAVSVDAEEKTGGARPAFYRWRSGPGT